MSNVNGKNLRPQSRRQSQGQTWICVARQRVTGLGAWEFPMWSSPGVFECNEKTFDIRKVDCKLL